MKFPGKFEEAQELGERLTATLGGHHMVITQAIERTSSKGRPLIELSLDMAPNDSQPGLCRQMYDGRKVKEGEVKKWPQEGKYYISVTDETDSTSSSFKNFVVALEASNPGFLVPRAEFDVQIFKGKRIGAVYGPEQDYYNGKVYTKHKIFRFVDDGKLGEVTVPAMRETPAYKEYAAHGGAAGATDSNIWEDADLSDLPFN